MKNPLKAMKCRNGVSKAQKAYNVIPRSIEKSITKDIMNVDTYDP